MLPTNLPGGFTRAGQMMKRKKIIQPVFQRLSIMYPGSRCRAKKQAKLVCQRSFFSMHLSTSQQSYAEGSIEPFLAFIKGVGHNIELSFFPR